MATVVLLVGCGSSSSNAARYQTVATDHYTGTLLAQEKNDQAILAIEAGDLATAEELLTDALAVDVTFGPAHNNLGAVYFSQRKFYLAAWEFEYAAKLMPRQPEPRNNLGLVLESVRKLDEAVAHYEAARAAAPDDLESLGNLTRAKFRRGDPEEQLRPLFQELLLKDDRPDWRRWAQKQLAKRAAEPPIPPGG